MYTPLPIGIDDFKKLITSKYYYVDKTGFIMELLDKKGEANLFTRPRRFGKTLNMSMLKYYFEIPIDGKSNIDLFQGLQILGAGEQYTKEQEQYPVIMLTLKSAKQPNWEMSYASMSDDIAAEYARHSYVLNADNILYADKEKFIQIRDRKANQIEYAKSLAFLSRCLELYHHKKTIILIDEYDVPLENAYYGGFYEEMLAFISSLFESALMQIQVLHFLLLLAVFVLVKRVFLQDLII